MKNLLKGVWVDDVLHVNIIYNMEAPENADISVENGVLVEGAINFPVKQSGKLPVLRANIEGETWFEEIDVPLTEEEMLLTQLEQQQSLIDMLILDSLGGVSDV